MIKSKIKSMRYKVSYKKNVVNIINMGYIYLYNSS